MLNTKKVWPVHPYLLETDLKNWESLRLLHCTYVPIFKLKELKAHLFFNLQSIVLWPETADTELTDTLEEGEALAMSTNKWMKCQLENC